MYTLARMLLVGLLAIASFPLLDRAQPAAPSAPPPAASRATPARIVYLGGKLSDEALIAFGSTVAARPGALLLLDSPGLSPYLRHFLSAYRPDRVVPVGSFPEGRAGLSRRLGVEVDPITPWPSASGVCPLWHDFPTPSSVVVCSPRSRALLLRAACLAACEGAPLWITSPDPDDASRLDRFVRDSGLRQVVLVGRTSPRFARVRTVCLPTAQDVDAACHRYLARDGRIDVAVVTNPADTSDGRGGMSALAPWLAVDRRAALLLCNEAGTNVEALLGRAVGQRSLAGLDTLILLANGRAIPTHKRPNPIPEDKDKHIDLEPLTPALAGDEAPGAIDEPFSYAIGRLFHHDVAAVPLMLARQRLLRESRGPRKALVASNPGGGLGLLETFSRNTAQELVNAGYEVTGLYGKELTGPLLRKQMPGHEIILWEGHHNTLVKEWGFTTWAEPMPPSFVFLQSCLALQPEKVEPLLSRGACAVLGTSTRTYSGSGGAFSLAYFNALLYEGQSLGGSLRQAKNFLLAYAALKQKRLGDQAARTGANHRAAWAFTLWGDPTFRLPRPRVPASALTAVRHRLEVAESGPTANTIVLELPGTLHGKVVSDRYQVRMPPNSRLAGLIRKTRDDDGHPLVPLLFAEVSLPEARAGITPRLRTRLPSSQWVFLWDARRRTGYLLATPRSCERAELRFRVEWPGMRVVGQSPIAIEARNAGEGETLPR